VIAIARHEPKTCVKTRRQTQTLCSRDTVGNDRIMKKSLGKGGYVSRRASDIVEIMMEASAATIAYLHLNLSGGPLTTTEVNIKSSLFGSRQ
jgi:hypothetical protein